VKDLLAEIKDTMTFIARFCPFFAISRNIHCSPRRDDTKEMGRLSGILDVSGGLMRVYGYQDLYGANIA
jgi:hypothetical protein